MPPKWNPDGADWVDYGLGGFLQSAGYAPEVYEPEMGKHKVPTLCSVDLRPSSGFVKAYGHNGYFKSREEIVFFYHWRAAMDGGMCGGMGPGMGGGMGPNPNLFPAPEVDQNRAEMQPFKFMVDGDRLLAFLQALSDGYFQR